MAAIKLPPIPREESISVRFTIGASKHAALNDYLAFFNEVHGSSVDLKMLVPHMLAAFLADDRAFTRWRASKTPKRPTRPAPTIPKAPPPDLAANSSKRRSEATAT